MPAKAQNAALLRADLPATPAEIRVNGEVFPTAQSGRRRSPLLLRADRDGKTLSTLRPTAFEDRATPLGLHSRSEAVAPLPTTTARLVGSLHASSLRPGAGGSGRGGDRVPSGSFCSAFAEMGVWRVGGGVFRLAMRSRDGAGYPCCRAPVNARNPRLQSSSTPQTRARAW